MRREIFCLSLSRYAQASTAALIALVLASAARADTVKKFDVSGTATNVTGFPLGSCAAGDTCSFFAILTIGVTTDTLEAGHITFLGLLACSHPEFSGPSHGDVWHVDINDGGGPVLSGFANHPTDIMAYKGLAARRDAR